jgi:hypothetical protein
MDDVKQLIFSEQFSTVSDAVMYLNTSILGERLPRPYDDYWGDRIDALEIVPASEGYIMVAVVAVRRE